MRRMRRMGNIADCQKTCQAKSFGGKDRVCHALPRFNNRPILHLTIVFYHKYRGQGENEKVPKDQKRDWDEKSPI